MQVTPPVIEHLTATGVREGFEFSAAAEAASDTFLALLSWLPGECGLRFYDPFYPSASDPGAYISVRRKGDVLVYMLANHGWPTMAGRAAG
jgi:hypothetical protein